MPLTEMVLELARIGRIDEARCDRCRDPLEMHQPDVASPDRLIGTCGGCHGWFLIDAEAGLMLRLPDLDALPDD